MEQKQSFTQNKIKFCELSKGDLFCFSQNESFGTMKVKSLRKDFKDNNEYLISLPDRSELIITRTNSHVYNCSVTIKSKYVKRVEKHNKNKHEKAKIKIN